MRSITTTLATGIILLASATAASASEATNAYNDHFYTVTTTTPGVYAPQGEVREYAPPYPEGSKGTLLRTFGQGLLSGPEGIAIDETGDVWVLDVRGTTIGGSRITEFSSAGALLAQVTPETYLGWSLSLAIDRGNLYIADWTGQKVQEFTPTGAFLRAFDEGNEYVSNPAYIGVEGKTGNLDVTNAITGYRLGRNGTLESFTEYETREYTPEGVRTK